MSVVEMLYFKIKDIMQTLFHSYVLQKEKRQF